MTFIFLYFQLDALFLLSTYNICYPLSSTCFRPHRPIIRSSKLYMQPMEKQCIKLEIKKNKLY